MLPRKLQAALEQALERKNELISQDSDSDSDDGEGGQPGCSRLWSQMPSALSLALMGAGTMLLCTLPFQAYEGPGLGPRFSIFSTPGDLGKTAQKGSNHLRPLLLTRNKRFLSVRPHLKPDKWNLLVLGRQNSHFRPVGKVVFWSLISLSFTQQGLFANSHVQSRAAVLAAKCSWGEGNCACWGWECLAGCRAAPKSHSFPF